MSRLRQAGPAILFLVAVLLSYSGPAEGGHKTFPSTQNDTGSEWQSPEEMEEESNEEMRMVGSEVAQRNQYPYMVRSNFKMYYISTQVKNNNVLKININQFKIQKLIIPKQVSLAVQRNKRLFKFCGGSLITWNKILTAAHCVTEGQSTRCRFED